MIRALAVASFLVSLAPGAALAFRDSATFALPVSEGGGAGKLWNGSPRWGGPTCASCHTETCYACHDDKSGFTLKLAIPLAEQFPEHRYQPGQRYDLSLELVGHHIRPQGSEFGDLFDAAAATPSNLAAFSFEIVNDAREALPLFDAAVLDPALLPLDGGRVAGTVATPGRRAWTVSFVAPPAGTGRVAIYLAAVASIGNDHDKETDLYVRRVDLADDDVLVMPPLVLCEGAARCDRALPISTGVDADSPAHSFGCAVAPSRRLAGSWAPWLLLAIAVLRTPVRRGRRDAGGR